MSKLVMLLTRLFGLVKSVSLSLSSRGAKVKVLVLLERLTDLPSCCHEMVGMGEPVARQNMDTGSLSRVWLGSEML